ncbi:hypothetical protein C8D95_10814 [Silicimonas algicola]|uniref:Uncharacterized protein n=1 Tax=Silicimonas algicola TaxID=1826607 RepID=A0A316G2Q9_9RHOB|nr:hypothetical protein C8D95_10814 [Silicimonas algicola]
MRSSCALGVRLLAGAPTEGTATSGDGLHHYYAQDSLIVRVPAGMISCDGGARCRFCGGERLSAAGPVAGYRFWEGVTTDSCSRASGAPPEAGVPSATRSPASCSSRAFSLVHTGQERGPGACAIRERVAWESHRTAPPPTPRRGRPRRTGARGSRSEKVGAGRLRRPATTSRSKSLSGRFDLAQTQRDGPVSFWDHGRPVPPPSPGPV